MHNVCNFNCSYCSDYHRDGTSRWPKDWKPYLDLIEKLKTKNKNLYIEVLGGEPTVWPKFQEVISEEVGKFDIKTMWNERNDGSFLINGKWKKFVGGGKVDVFEWTETNMTISYELDIDMANRIRDLDYKKTLKSVYLDAVEYEDSRPHIIHKIKHDGDMSEIIGGLWDIEPSIDQEKLNSDVVYGISKRLNYQVRKENLNGEELESIINRGKLRLWNDDWMNKGYDTHYKL